MDLRGIEELKQRHVWDPFSSETRENANPCLFEASEEKHAHDLHDASMMEE